MCTTKPHYVASILKPIKLIFFFFFLRMEQELQCIINQYTTFRDVLADLTYLRYIYYL